MDLSKQELDILSSALEVYTDFLKKQSDKHDIQQRRERIRKTLTNVAELRVRISAEALRGSSITEDTLDALRRKLNDW